MKKILFLALVVFASLGARAQCNPSFTYDPAPTVYDIGSGANQTLSEYYLNYTVTNTTSFTPAPGQSVSYYLYSYQASLFTGTTGVATFHDTGMQTISLVMEVYDSTSQSIICQQEADQSIYVQYPTCFTYTASKNTYHATDSTLYFLSAGNPQSSPGMVYTWSFDDGTILTGQNAVYTRYHYQNPSTTVYTLTATNGSCNYNAGTQTIYSGDVFSCAYDVGYGYSSYPELSMENPQCGLIRIEDYGVGPNNYMYYNADASPIGTPFTYQYRILWGDGDSSLTPDFMDFVTSFAHIYSTSGLYTVSEQFIITNQMDSTHETCIYNHDLTAHVLMPLYSFPLSVSGSTCPGGTIIASVPDTGILAGATYSHYDWYTQSGLFGVGNTVDLTGLAAGDTVFYVFEAYSQDENCAISSTPVAVAIGAPVLDTIAGPSSITVGAMAQLINSFAGGNWGSSDGSIVSVDGTGMITGLAEGTATIVYIAGNDCGADTATKVVTVTSTTVPMAGFTANQTNGCVMLPIQFTDQSTGTPTSWAWDFGDASTDNTQNPLHHYTTAGTYTVRLIATNTNGSDTLTMLNYITVGAPPTVDTIAGPASVCMGYTLMLTNTTGGGTWMSSEPIIVSIDAAGTATGNIAGSATILYIVTNTCGSDTVTKDINVIAFPNAYFSDSLVPGTCSTTYQFTNLSIDAATTSWIIGGDAYPSTDLLYTFPLQPTPYTETVSIAATNECGTTVYSLPVSINDSMPSTSISGDIAICANDSTLISISGMAGATVSYDLNNAPLTATLDNTGNFSFYAYPNDNATLTNAAAASGCSQAISGESATVSVIPAPVASFTVSDSFSCAIPLVVSFTANTGPSYQYNWDFGDGILATNTINATHIYLFTGIYTISLAETNACGISDTLVMPNYIVAGNSNPVTATATAGTCGDVATLNAANAVSYSWVPSTNLSCTACATATATPTVTTAYTVTGVDVNGCTSMDTVTVNVNSNKIAGTLSFSGVTPDTTEAKVWLIQYNAGTQLLSAVDSVVTCAQGSTPYYEFNNPADGMYLTKAQMLYGNNPGGSGYIPTYAATSPLWSAAQQVNHTGGYDASVNITMQYGTVTAGPGFIGGYVYGGANKNTDLGVPVPNMVVFLENNNSLVLTYTVTDVAGHYAFNALAAGTYIVYPEALNYATTAYTNVVVTGGTQTDTAISFKKNDGDLTIVPLVTTAVANVNSSAFIQVYPNPASAAISVEWGNVQAGDATLAVTDATGRKVIEKALPMHAAGKQQISLAGLADGVYLLSINGMGVNYTSKLTVQH